MPSSAGGAIFGAARPPGLAEPGAHRLRAAGDAARGTPGGMTAGRAVAGATRLLGDRDFMGLTLIGGFAMASFFIFIASASFVYTEQFGLSPTGFSLAFALNAIGFFGASQTAATLGERFGMARLVLRRWRVSRR